MKVAWGISWNDSKKGRLLGAAMSALLALSLISVSGSTPDVSTNADEMVSVIVRGVSGTSEAEQLVERAGGDIGRRIDIIDGFMAELPARELAQLERNPVIHSITLDSKVQMLHSVDGFDASDDMGSMWTATGAIRARYMWNQGITGSGVDVAVIDTGVAPVTGLTEPGKVINGPDLSYESQADNLRYLDTNGHGTHLAGIIAGRDPGWDPTNHDAFGGVAPHARIVNIKVANAMGAADVSQVLAGIDWVVQHRNDNGMNIRVLNLAFGTNGVQSYLVDPLTYAAEVAWRKGIVVVVAAGNSQFGTDKLNNPAYDPFVIAVGADNTKGTWGDSDDIVPMWSARNSTGRTVNLIAPGRSIASLRAPGSHVDLTYPGGIVNSRFMRGSGTSQATAMVSGAAALLLQQRPSLTPDQVKRILRVSADPIPNAETYLQGKGLVDMKVASETPTPLDALQSWAPATGTGSLEQARGSVHVVDPNGVELNGEKDIFGMAWDPVTWSASSLTEASWSGGSWNGSLWSGNSWSGNSWSGNSWSGNSWSGNSWSGSSWSSSSWS